MVEALAHRGPDGFHRLSTGPLLLGHLHLNTTPEERPGDQPLTTADGGFCLALDGRLDNREEVLALLGEKPWGAEAPSDAAIILAAYRRWRTEAFDRFVGPFAALIFDQTEHRLVAVRDPLGDRTLFYCETPDLLVFASEEAALAKHPAVPQGWNEERLARYFGVAELRDGSTFFAGVQELLPAHWMAATPERTFVRRYWEPDLSRRVHYRDDREYGEHFREILDTAVRCRLRSAAPAAIQMSGGLDSTGIAALAAQAVSRPPKVFSWVFDTLPSCDERAYMDPVVERYGLVPRRVLGDDAWPLARPELRGVNPNTPEDTAYRPLVERLYKSAKADGVRVLLTGMFGDHLFSGFEAWLTEAIMGGRWPTAFGEVGWYLSHRRWRQLRPAVGYPLLRWPRFRRLWSGPAAPWLTPSAQRGRKSGGDWRPAAGRASRPTQLQSLLGLLGAHGISAESFHASRHGLELRHPYRDRRLVEFMLAVPADQLYRRGLLKWILRVGLRNDLPEGVRNRPDSTSLWPLFLKGLSEKEKPLVDRLVFQGKSQWSQYVQESWLRERLPGRSDTDPAALVLWLCIAFELWRERLQGSTGSARPRREAV